MGQIPAYFAKKPGKSEQKSGFSLVLLLVFGIIVGYERAGAGEIALMVRGRDIDRLLEVVRGERLTIQQEGSESMAKKAATIKAATKGEIYTKLATSTGLTKKQVSTVFDELTKMIGNELGKKGPGLFLVPGLLKLKVVRKPATKAKRGSTRSPRSR